MYTCRECSASLTSYPFPQATPLQSGSPPDVHTVFSPQDKNRGRGAAQGGRGQSNENGNKYKRLGGLGKRENDFFRHCMWVLSRLKQVLICLKLMKLSGI